MMIKWNVGLHEHVVFLLCGGGGGVFKKRKLLVEMHPFSMLSFGLEDDAVSKAVFCCFGSLLYKLLQGALWEMSFALLSCTDWCNMPVDMELRFFAVQMPQMCLTTFNREPYSRGTERAEDEQRARAPAFDS